MRAVCLGLAVGLLAGCGTRSVAPGPKVYERDEFRAAVEGKTQDEVLKLLGKPDQTSDTGPDSDWDYRERTYDRVSGKTDFSVRLVFRKGVVHHMLF